VAIANASAHFLRRDVVAWDVDVDAGASFELRWSATAAIAAAGSDVVGGQVIALQPAGQVGADATLAAVAKNLAAFAEFTLDAGDLAIVKQALQGQLVAVARGSDGGVLSATNVQIGAALDDLYAYEGPLGVAWFDGGAPTLALWAPTARSVVLNVFDEAKVAVASQPMSQGASGVWSLSGPASWTGKYYQYQVTVYHPVSNKVETFNVTDPYSVNLSTNGVYSQIVDLADPALQPPGWTTFAKPPLAAPEDIVIYESHIRDFSTLDPTVPAEQAGKFLAFASDGGARTAGQQHLQALARSGLTHVHLLPAFDIATVDEDATHRVDLRSPYADLCLKIPGLDGGGECAPHAGQTVLDAYRSYPGNSDQQQRLAGLTRAYDAYNWGYDPFHYGAIEGSYASTAEGTAKIVEFRQMVQGLSALGLRTVMDVVYNHTNASGPTSDKSVLDRVVPGYYHRLDQTSGVVLTSSCCSNTATERRMMERLMVDTLVRWARDFKVDGFRFDLMGFHTTSNLAKVRAALDALTLAQDGVDGHAIYLYGEGWDAPEVNDRGVSANQVNMAGTGVGTFNDRLRDAVRGGGPFDNGSDFRKNQGFSNGLYYDPNELDDGGIVVNKTITPTLQQLLTEGDLIKVGMAGSLREFRLQTRTGSITAGGAIGYNGARAGYTLDPQESINYVSAHDNQTLWDILAYKLPTGTPTVDRVRAYDVALDTVLLGQGIPFFHLGDDVLRSKSMDKNSYDSGDWFNQVDWSGHTNGWKSGLPNGPDDQANWSTILPIFADATAAVSQANISAASDHFREMLRIRTGSPLFRLRTKAEVMTRVDFFNTGPGQIPGVIAMTLTDAACAGADLDPVRDALVVVLNADKVAHDVTIPGASGFTLHTVLQASTDPVVRTASVSGAVFTVPARTSAVFEQLQGGSRGSGLPCNTR
jgi:pullulanase-type alpha-1,6-glucosidase